MRYAAFAILPFVATILRLRRLLILSPLSNFRFDAAMPTYVAFADYRAILSITACLFITPRRAFHFSPADGCLMPINTVTPLPMLLPPIDS